MWVYNHVDELMHYGVKGMKWGVRRTYTQMKASYKKAKKDANKSFNKAYNKSIAAYSPIKKHRQANNERWNDATEKILTLEKARSEYKSAKKAFKADERSKAAAKKALAKMEKQQYKEFVRKRSKEILAGESVLGKIWDVTTGGHKTQAQVEYDINKRAKVNKAYRD